MHTPEQPSVDCTKQKGLAGWEEASKTGQIHLVMEITRASLDALLDQKQLHVIRGSNRIAVAALPNIRSLILPTKLDLVTVGANQFALQGQGAESIDAVTLQGPKGPFGPYEVATGAGIALISLPQKSSTKGNPNDANIPTNPDFSPTSGRAGTLITITGKGFGAEKGTVKFTDASKNPTEGIDPKWTDACVVIAVPKGAKPGPLEVMVTPKGKTPIEFQYPFKVDEKGAAPKAAPPCGALTHKTAPADNSNGAGVPGPGTYTVLPLVSWQKDGKETNEKGNKLYLPVDVTDPHGKPVTYTIADDTQKPPAPDSNGTQVGPSTTVTITKKTTETPPPAKAPANRTRP
jgi:hypothetical protein